MSAPGLGCTRAPGRRVPRTPVRGFAPRAGLGDWDFLYGRGLAVTVPETPHWPVSGIGTMDGLLPVVTRTRCYHTLLAVWDEPWFGEPEGY